LLRIAWLLLQLLYFLGLGLSVIGCMIMSTAIVQDLRGLVRLLGFSCCGWLALGVGYSNL